MSETMAVVMITVRQGGRPVDTEVPVRTLSALYDACRNSPPAALVRVAIRGPEGEVLLNFASIIRS